VKGGRERDDKAGNGEKRERMIRKRAMKSEGRRRETRKMGLEDGEW
jgi:hypothetical protein